MYFLRYPYLGFGVDGFTARLIRLVPALLVCDEEGTQGGRTFG